MRIRPSEYSQFVCYSSLLNNLCIVQIVNMMIKKTQTRISTHMTSRVMKLIKLVKHFHLTRYSKCIRILHPA